MWTVLIADDEPAARRGVCQLLAPYAADFTVVGECRDGREALRALDATTPDVVFLDVQMPEVDGFEVIRRRGSMPAVIFLTAFDEFAIRAFEAEALDYLLKPVSVERFAATIARLKRRLRGGDASLAVTTSRGVRVFHLEEIERIEAADNYARLWVGNRSYLLRRPLSDLEHTAAAHGFVRAHRQALVRVAAVQALEDSGGDMVAILESGAVVPVSRRRRAAFSMAVRGRGRPPK
jgi:two-component system LytT family response regulator